MENKQRWASATPTMTLIFSMLAMMFWANFMGYLKPEAALLLGVIQVGIFPAYLIGAVILLKEGDALNGNVFFYFATWFGFVAGLINIVTYFAPIYNWAIDPRITGYFWLWAAVMLYGSLPAYRKVPWVFFTVLFCAATALLLIALTSLELVPVVFNIAAGWCLFVVGVFGLYLAVAGLLENVGIILPQGKPFFK